MSIECYHCLQPFSESRPRVTHSPPTCRACWVVSSDQPPPNEFADETPTDPFLIPVYGRFSVED